jgi:hypothetical protein
LEIAKLQAENATSSPVNIDPVLDVARNIRLVPKFNEKDVEKFLLHFEKVSTNLKRQKDWWSALVQSVLSGKAQEIYSSLAVDLCNDYEKVKQSILKAYELV